MHTEEMASLAATTEDEVSKIMLVGPSKTCSLGPMPSSMVKDCSQELTPVITNIINSSMAEGVVPDMLLKKLQMVQDTAAHLVTRAKRHDHITPVLARLHWLPDKQCISFKILLLTAWVSALLHGSAAGCWGSAVIITL